MHFCFTLFVVALFFSWSLSYSKNIFFFTKLKDLTTAVYRFKWILAPAFGNRRCSSGPSTSSWGFTRTKPCRTEPTHTSRNKPIVAANLQKKKTFKCFFRLLLYEMFMSFPHVVIPFTFTETNPERVYIGRWKITVKVMKTCYSYWVFMIKQSNSTPFDRTYHSMFGVFHRSSV